MRIDHLSLTNFRNYARLELTLPRQPIVLYGDNAQGKTSILEAIYYLATSRSPYTTSDRQLIHWRTESEYLPFARLVAEITAGHHRVAQRLEITLMMDKSNGLPRFQKEIRLNGVKKRVMDVVGLLNVVLFLPQDLALVEGAPSERRRFMDTTLCQTRRDYLEALNTYEKVLPQRNALLRQIAERRASPAELAYWDEQLAQAGAILIHERQVFLRSLELLAQRTHHELTAQRETLTLSYQPSFVPSAEGDGQRSFEVFGLDLHRELSPQAIAPQFHDQLRREQALSIQRGATLSGPHRDELRLLINDRDCGLYGSRGQARTAIMALKFAELQWMQSQINEAPLLLLDEVVAELDSKRRAYLLERISDDAQTLVTTTELDIFTQDFITRSRLLHVHDGQVDEV